MTADLHAVRFATILKELLSESTPEEQAEIILHKIRSFPNVAGCDCISDNHFRIYFDDATMVELIFEGNDALEVRVWAKSEVN